MNPPLSQKNLASNNNINTNTNTYTNNTLERRPNNPVNTQRSNAILSQTASFTSNMSQQTRNIGIRVQNPVTTNSIPLSQPNITGIINTSYLPRGTGSNQNIFSHSTASNNPQYLKPQPNINVVGNMNVKSQQSQQQPPIPNQPKIQFQQQHQSHHTQQSQQYQQYQTTRINTNQNYTQNLSQSNNISVGNQLVNNSAVSNWNDPYNVRTPNISASIGTNKNNLNINSNSQMNIQYSNVLGINSNIHPPNDYSIAVEKTQKEKLERENMALQEQIRKLHDEKFELNACLMVNKMEAAQEASKEIRSLQSQLRFKDEDIERLKKQLQHTKKELVLSKHNQVQSSSTTTTSAENTTQSISKVNVTESKASNHNSILNENSQPNKRAKIYETSNSQEVIEEDMSILPSIKNARVVTLEECNNSMIQQTCNELIGSLISCCQRIDSIQDASWTLVIQELSKLFIQLTNLRVQSEEMIFQSLLQICMKMVSMLLNTLNTYSDNSSVIDLNDELGFIGIESISQSNEYMILMNIIQAISLVINQRNSDIKALRNGQYILSLDSNNNSHSNDLEKYVLGSLKFSGTNPQNYQTLKIFTSSITISTNIRDKLLLIIHQVIKLVYKFNIQNNSIIHLANLIISLVLYKQTEDIREKLHMLLFLFSGRDHTDMDDHEVNWTLVLKYPIVLKYAFMYVLSTLCSQTHSFDVMKSIFYNEDVDVMGKIIDELHCLNPNYAYIQRSEYIVSSYHVLICCLCKGLLEKFSKDTMALFLGSGKESKSRIAIWEASDKNELNQKHYEDFTFIMKLSSLVVTLSKYFCETDILFNTEENKTHFQILTLMNSLIDILFLISRSVPSLFMTKSFSNCISAIHSARLQLNMRNESEFSGIKKKMNRLVKSLSQTNSI